MKGALSVFPCTHLRTLPRQHATGSAGIAARHRPAGPPCSCTGRHPNDTAQCRAQNNTAQHRTARHGVAQRGRPGRTHLHRHAAIGCAEHPQAAVQVRHINEATAPAGRQGGGLRCNGRHAGQSAQDHIPGTTKHGSWESGPCRCRPAVGSSCCITPAGASRVSSNCNSPAQTGTLPGAMHMQEQASCAQRTEASPDG